MAKWLDKYEQGGLVLKKKTKDNYGKRENANEGYSTAGPGWVGEGTTNKDFDYNGAWGGTMAMGGALPGAVGFTYARTQDPAPSNGPYAKKTLASAQSGKNIPTTAGKVYHAEVNDEPIFNDPLTKLHTLPTTADSTRLYNSQMALNKFYENEMKAGRITKDWVSNFYGNIDKDLRQANLDFYRTQIQRRANKLDAFDNEYKEIFNLSPEQVRQLEYKGLAQTKGSSEYQEYYRDLVTPLQNLMSPFALVDKRISPQRRINYLPKNSDYPGGNVTVYDYDPILIKPVNMLTPEERALRIKRYGKDSGIKETVSKPIQKIVSKPKPKPKPKPEPEPTPVVEQQPVTTPIQQPTPQPKQLYNYDDGEQLMAPIPNGWGFGTMGGGAVVGVKKKDGTIEYIKPEDYKRMGVPKYGQDYIKSKQKMQKGGVIKDDRGQWAYPGEVTEIGSNDITMQGVDYPVLGVSDTGDTQMMYPDQDYKFDGEKVTEYPMAQNGDWLSKYATEPMRQDATRNVVPRKMTDKEKLEAVATSDQAQKRALNSVKEVITERKKNKATKGDLNTPGSWHIKDKARLFPSSVGGAGEMFDEYVNPATYVGILGDALGESVAARDPKGIATSLGLSAIGGGLGFDPIGGGIKAVKSIGKGIVKPSFNSGKEAYDFINNMVNNGQEEQMLNILTKKTGKTSRQLENEFGRAIGNDGTIRDPEYIIRHANMLSGKNNLPKLPKSLKELDEKAGKLVSPSSSSEFNTTDSKMIARANEILKKGVGIKNKDIPIELRSKHNGELELWVNDNNPKYVTGQSKSGTIDLSPNFKEANKSLTFTDWLKGEKPKTKYNTYDPDAIPGVIKAGDFPYQSRLDLEGTGIGAEAAEALKQALNEEGLQLFSSKSHTEAGKLRYLTEFLNNRKQVVDYSDNPDWMNRASTLRDLLGGAPISKKEAKAYISQYPELKPAHVRFQYDNGGWLNKYK